MAVRRFALLLPELSEYLLRLSRPGPNTETVTVGDAFWGGEGLHSLDTGLQLCGLPKIITKPWVTLNVILKFRFYNVLRSSAMMVPMTNGDPEGVPLLSHLLLINEDTGVALPPSHPHSNPYPVISYSHNQVMHTQMQTRTIAAPYICYTYIYIFNRLYVLYHIRFDLRSLLRPGPRFHHSYTSSSEI